MTAKKVSGYFFKEIILFVLLYLQLLPDSSQCLQNYDHLIAMCKCSKFFVVKQPWISVIVAHCTNTTDCSSEMWVATNLSKSCCGLRSLINFWWCSYSRYEFGKTDPWSFLKPLESLKILWKSCRKSENDKKCRNGTKANPNSIHDKIDFCCLNDHL